MTRLDFGATWRDTAAAFARDRSTYLTLAAAFVLLPAMAAQVFGPASPRRIADVGTAVLFVQLGLALVSMAAQLTIMRMMLRGDAPRAALAVTLPKVPVLFLAGVLTALALLPATSLIAAAMQGTRAALLPGLALLIPGVFVASRLALAGPLIAAHGLGAVASLRASWLATAGNGWRILGVLAAFAGLFLVVALLAAALGGAVASVLLLLGGKAFASFVATLLPAAASAAYAAVNAVALATIFRRLTPAP